MSAPSGPPGPPRHTHDDGMTCQYVRRDGIDRWRQVDATGWDQGPCPQESDALLDTKESDLAAVEEGMSERWNPGFDFEKTWYLAGPMSGYPEYNYPAFHHAATVLRETGIKLESPAENEWPPKHKDLDEKALWDHMMDLGRKQISRCQGIILLKGWPQSTGACAELNGALKAGWPVWYFHNFQLTNMNKED